MSDRFQELMAQIMSEGLAKIEALTDEQIERLPND
jgi:uncharacterized protein YoaH (UPF0181 family)